MSPAAETAAPGPTVQVGIIEVIEEEVEAEVFQMYDDYFGAFVASLEERIYLSDVVVRAVLLSAKGGTLRFRALEYLKGTGAGEFEIRTLTDGRNTAWDAQEAVLFLAAPPGGGGSRGRSSGGASAFEFADTTAFDYIPESIDDATSYAGNLPEGYTLDSRNPVWLPLESSGSGSRAKSVAGGASTGVALADLREKIAWIEGGAGNSEYEDCIRYALRHIRWGRDYEVYHGRPRLPEYEIQIESGLPAGTEFTDYGTHGFPGYGRFWVAGPDAELFNAEIIDADDDPTNGFRDAVTTGRPLPDGTYRVISHMQGYYFEPCNFTTTYNRLLLVVTATAPEGTLAEALFDPLAVGAAVTATTTVGTIGWEAGEVRATLSQNVTGHVLDFIALDGTVSLSLTAASATSTAETLSWAVSSQPWEDGDLLMLRISRVKQPAETSGRNRRPAPPPQSQTPSWTTTTLSVALRGQATRRNVGDGRVHAERGNAK